MEPPTPTQGRLAVVLVHRNQPEACERTTERFRSHGRPLRLIVVDNGSEPDRLAALHAWADPAADVEVIEAGTNTGFGPGANIGLRAWLHDPDGGEWAPLAPHDAAPRPGCLDALIAAIDAEPLAGLACADVGDGMVPFIDPYFGGIIRPGGTEAGWETADYPHGTLMALRRSCLTDIGLFEESFFAYCEEADLGLRARRAGWTVGLVRGARVQNTHLSSSVAVVDYLQQRNTLRFVRELSGRYHVAVRMVISLGHIRRGVMHPAGAPPVFDPRARLYGMRDFLLGRRGPPPPEVLALEARHRRR